MKRKRRINPYKKHLSEEDIYLSEIGGFEFIAGFTSGGVPFGIQTNIDGDTSKVAINNNGELNDERVENINDEDFPF